MLFRAAIRSALEGRLATYAASKNIKVAYQNATFQPPSTAYLACFLMAAPTENTGLCYGTERAVGVFQINVNTPVNTGNKALDDIAKEISDLFPAGLELSILSGTEKVRVVKPLSNDEYYIGSSHATLVLSLYYSTV